MKIKQLYLTNRFFVALGIIVLLFSLGYAWPLFFAIGKTGLVIIFACTIADAFILFNKNNHLTASRQCAKVLSLGNKQTISISIANMSNMGFNIELIDEIPSLLQKRDFMEKLHLKAQQQKKLTYPIRPLTRGVYNFGKIQIFITSTIHLAKRRISIEADQDIAVYPSIIDMKSLELKSVKNNHVNFGIKKLRRIGHSYEFEQIKEYTKGDDIKSMNWKATSRANKLMVNSYTDEKSQQIYCLIDEGRYMKMPFNGLSLLDYSINSSLVIANTALNKQDKAGLITFSDTPKRIIKADRSRMQLKIILEALYKEKISEMEANYERLYKSIQSNVRGRSLLFLYSNFESLNALHRVLPILRKLNLAHLLVVIVFENEELTTYQHQEANNLKEIYFKTIAQKINIERELILTELKRYGIQHIFTQPQNLSINAINKYLELKSKGLI